MLVISAIYSETSIQWKGKFKRPDVVFQHRTEPGYKTTGGGQYAA